MDVAIHYVYLCHVMIDNLRELCWERSPRATRIDNSRLSINELRNSV